MDHLFEQYVLRVRFLAEFSANIVDWVQILYDIKIGL